MKRFLFLLLFTFTATLAQAKEGHSVWLFNETDNQIKLGTQMSITRPIASLTKLMTAMVSLDYSKDLTIKYPLTKKVHSNLPNDQYTREDLLNAMLVRSDNGAAETLAENYPGGRKEFIKAMNAKAKALGMTSTAFSDPTGLSSSNTSNAGEVGTMVSNAAKYDFIKQTSTKKQVMFESIYKKKIRKVQLNNTNRPLLFEFDNIIVSKTGFTNPAGFCLGLAVEQNKKRYIIVILGAKNPKQRIDLVENIMYNHIIDQDLQDYYGSVRHK